MSQNKGEKEGSLLDGMVKDETPTGWHLNGDGKDEEAIVLTVVRAFETEGRTCERHGNFEAQKEEPCRWRIVSGAWHAVSFQKEGPAAVRKHRA